MSRPIRIGLLGASRIAPDAIVVPARGNPDVEVVAVAARDRVRAEAFASTHDIPKAFDSYADLCSSDDVDLIYISTPPVNHLEWTLAALSAGKHVVCEKPFAMNATQARRMVDAGRTSGLTLMEAYHWRYHPMANRLAEILGSGALGDLIDIDCWFTIPFVPKGDFRWETAAGGGVLMDVGCYPVQWARFVANAEPTDVSAQMIAGPSDRSDTLADATIDATLSFPAGVTARLHSDMSESSTFAAKLTVNGTKGSMVVTNPLVPQQGNSIALTDVVSGVTTTESVETTTTYEWQLRAIVESTRHAMPLPTGGDDAIKTMSVIDAIYRAAGFGPRPGN
jgi:predicted dehydrogenase